MNCRRVKKLIPLYIEGDLKPGVASHVTSHLNWCDRCNWLADEYKESQGWLRSFRPPEFDEMLFDSVRSGALKQIALSKAKPSALALLAQHWNRRQVLALSAGMLTLFGIVLLYVYQARVKVDATPEIVSLSPTSAAKSAEEAGRDAAPKAAPGAGLQGSRPAAVTKAGLRHVAGKRPHLAVRYTMPANAVETLESARLASEPAADQTAPLPVSFSNSKGMLRIEFQTSDPNIRIIWFAPGETDSHQSKPATE